MLVAENICKRYGKRSVLHHVSLKVRPKEVVAIVGQSGAGKSTLLHVLATLERPDKGTLRMDHTDLRTLDDKALSSFRNRSVGFVFQDHYLLPEFNVLENVCLPAYIRGESVRQAAPRGRDLLKLLDVLEHAERHPHDLSGGEQQRVAVARALINTPKIVFADEPSGSLDSRNAHLLHTLLLRLRDVLDQTFVLATHNTDLTDMADRVLRLEDGILVE